MSGDLGRMFNLTPVASPEADPAREPDEAAQSTPTNPSTAHAATDNPPTTTKRHRRHPQPTAEPPTPNSADAAAASLSPADGPSLSELEKSAPRRPVGESRQRRLGGGPARNQPRPDVDVVPATDTAPRRRAASAASTGGRVQIMIYVPEPVYEQFRHEAAETGLSYGQLALLCVDRSYDNLSQVFADRAGATSRFFSTDYTPRSREKTTKVPVNLHLLQRDLTVIDELWPQLDGCRSRNDFLSTAAQQYLAHRDRM